MSCGARARFRIACLGVTLGVYALGSAGPAAAEPVDNPCDLAVGLLCRFLPIAPELDRDIDLTTDQPQVPATFEAPPIPGTCPPGYCG